MTALSESLPSMVICDVYSVLIPTYLHFSQVRKPVLDTTAFWLHLTSSTLWTHHNKPQRLSFSTTGLPVTSVVRVSQALLNCRGDCQSVVHSLISLLC